MATIGLSRAWVSSTTLPLTLALSAQQHFACDSCPFSPLGACLLTDWLEGPLRVLLTGGKALLEGTGIKVQVVLVRPEASGKAACARWLWVASAVAQAVAEWCTVWRSCTCMWRAERPCISHGGNV